MNTNDAIKVLKENGLKYTDKRKDMLDIFVKEDKYLNAKHIQQQMDKDYPGISFDTVYRNLHLFKDKSIFLINDQIIINKVFKTIYFKNLILNFILNLRFKMKTN